MTVRQCMDFYPRTPCGVRPGTIVNLKVFVLFLPTHPLRGATDRNPRAGRAVQHFYPRTPCGVRRQKCSRPHHRSPYFYPRTPCGVRRRRHGEPVLYAVISTHAPLAGCDRRPQSSQISRLEFLPTHPLRGATTCQHATTSRERFLPTHPLRGATRPERVRYYDKKISTHAPLAGCDL